MNPTYDNAAMPGDVTEELLPPPSSSTAARATADTSAYLSFEYLQHMCLLRGISRTVLAPMDRVKYIMQCQGELQRLGTLSSGFRSTRECVRHIARLEGNRSFWRGNCINLVSLLPIALAQLLIAVPTESIVFNLCPVHSAVGYTITGYTAVLAGAVAASMISYPLEFARFRLAVDVKPAEGAPYAIRSSLSFFTSRAINECPHYLYKGLALYILGSLVFQAVHNVLLGAVGPYVPAEYMDSGWSPMVIQCSCGLTISAAATLCLHPVDLVRRRMMIAVMDDRLRYPSTMHCVMRIAHKEGLRGFYRGGAVTLMRMVAATGLALVGLPY